LTNANINEVARAGVSFRPVEGNTGANPTDIFVRQDGSTWYVAVFNYNAFSISKNLNLARLGISGSYVAMDLWNRTLSTVNGPTWNLNLGSRQAKLFRLGSGSVGAVGPTNQALVVGTSTALSTVASGTPPFSYVWKRNGSVLAGQAANTIILNPVSLSDAGTYSVQVTGGLGSVTNQAILTLGNPAHLSAALDSGKIKMNWSEGHTGWWLQTKTNEFTPGVPGSWADVTGSSNTNSWVVPIDASAPSLFFRLVHP
jgi:hypothetical protein